VSPPILPFLLHLSLSSPSSCLHVVCPWGFLLPPLIPSSSAGRLPMSFLAILCAGFPPVFPSPFVRTPLPPCPVHSSRTSTFSLLLPIPSPQYCSSYPSSYSRCLVPLPFPSTLLPPAFLSPRPSSLDSRLSSSPLPSLPNSSHPYGPFSPSFPTIDLRFSIPNPLVNQLPLPPPPSSLPRYSLYRPFLLPHLPSSFRTSPFPPPCFYTFFPLIPSPAISPSTHFMACCSAPRFLPSSFDVFPLSCPSHSLKRLPTLLPYLFAFPAPVLVSLSPALHSFYPASISPALPIGTPSTSSTSTFLTCSPYFFTSSTPLGGPPPPSPPPPPPPKGQSGKRQRSL